MTSSGTRIFSEITHGRGRKNLAPATDTEALVKKILYGALYPHAIKAVCDQYGLVVKGKRIEYAEFFQYFSKAIVATDLPGFETDHLSPVRKREYLKMVQTKEGHFRFERPTPSRVGFFLWIESLQPTLGRKIYLDILRTFTIRDPAKK